MAISNADDDSRQPIPFIRFTKHEVKNGLLAAIGLCETIGGPKTKSKSSEVKKSDLGSKSLIAELDITLNEVLDTVLAEALTRDVVHEVYEPVLECINLPEILNDRARSHDGRFPLKVCPTPFPPFLLDPKIVKCIHRNAVSNSCKYGERGGVVATELTYNEVKKELEIKVVDRPGENHKNLVKLGPEEVNEVFSPGKSLHPGLPKDEDDHLERRFVTRSSGDGAWIMKKCARIMGGDCHIVFEEDRTVFTFKCPAVPYGHEHVVKDAANGPDFVIPKGTWGVGLDDSRIQRKLLDRFLCTLGIDLEHRRVLGEDANEILNFNRFVKELARDHPNDKILIIADENLDMEGSQTVSGSLSTQQLLEDLGGDRNRVLALVRSANDSKDDIDLYKSRTHGFIPKAPLKKDKVKEMIQPFWRERFGLDETQAAQIDPLSIAASSEVHNGVSIEAQTYDIMKTVEAIDALLDAPDEGEIAQRWPAIWEKLHLLRGDLLVIFGSARAKTVTEAINHLRGDEIPQGLKDRWALIRSLVLSLL